MGFFGEYMQWLGRLLATYIGDTAATVAGAIEPAVMTLATLYLMTWGYLQLTGRIDEPVTQALKRFALLALVIGGGLRLWLYNGVVVDTFFNAPTQLAAAVIGAYDPVTIVDQIVFTGGDAAEALLEKGGILHGHFSYDLAGVAVYLIVSLTAVYAVFLLSLSRIALSILLALGPLFIVLALFDNTRRFCEAWIAQLANYALIAILTVLVAALMMSLLSSAAQAAAATGGGVSIADAVRVCMAAGMTFLVMRQVMPMASGLASGVALSTFGLLSTAVMWGFGKSMRTGSSFARGAIFDGLRKEGVTSRWDPLSRQAGFHAGRFVRNRVASVARRMRPNSIQPTQP